MSDFIRRRPMLSAFLAFALLLTLPEHSGDRYGNAPAVVAFASRCESSRYVAGQDFAARAQSRFQIPFVKLRWIDKRVLEVRHGAQAVLSTDHCVSRSTRSALSHRRSLRCTLRPASRPGQRALRPILGRAAQRARQAQLLSCSPRAGGDGNVRPGLEGCAGNMARDQRRPYQEGRPARRNSACTLMTGCAPPRTQEHVDPRPRRSRPDHRAERRRGSAARCRRFRQRCRFYCSSCLNPNRRPHRDGMKTGADDDHHSTQNDYRRNFPGARV